MTCLRSAPRWFIAALSVAGITVVVCQFVELLHAERTLYQAAQAGAREASLPKATQRSVRRAVEIAIASDGLRIASDRPLITINARPLVLNDIEPLQTGDVIDVSLGAWFAEIVPDVLRPIGISLAGHKLRVSATVTKP